MEILFTTEELKNGYIKADVSTSKRTDLDKDKVAILKGMYRILFNINAFYFYLYFCLIFMKLFRLRFEQIQSASFKIRKAMA